MRKPQRPTKNHEVMGKCDPHEVYNHPAFGMIGWSVISGGDKHLFGSDIGHGHRIRLTIKRAEHKRNLSNDWYHARQQLIEIEMSHSQFAELITSPNRGDGIPCTLLTVVGESMPSIEGIETKQEMFRREIEESGRRRLDTITAEIARLGDLIESGKLPKGELRELHKNLAREAAYLPTTLSFVVGQAEEALERSTTHAKIEIEATINNHINRIGMDAAQAIGLLPPAGIKIKDIE